MAAAGLEMSFPGVILELCASIATHTSDADIAEPSIGALQFAAHRW